MRKKIKSLLYLAIFCSLAFTSCKSLKEVEVTGVKGFKVNKIDTEGINADIFLGIKNPNRIGFSIYKSTFDISYDGMHLGTARSLTRVHIDARTEKNYSFNLSGSLQNSNLISVVKMIYGAGKGQLEVKGNLKVGKFFLKKKIPVDFKERISLRP
jgi:LEA14-like dessication related protein